jgi:hypothetical protein
VLWKTHWKLEELDGNPMGTLREHNGNTLGTREK